MDSGVEFVAVDNPHATRLTLHILAAVAEHERTMISERTKAALAAAKARGKKLGGPKLALATKLGNAANAANADRFAENVAPVIRRHRPLPQLLPLPMQRHAFHVRHVTPSHRAVTRYRRPCNAVLGHRTVARLDHPARIVVQPVGRTLFLNTHDFERFAGQDHKRVIQTRRIDPNLVVADPFEHERHLLGGRMDEVY